MSFLFSSPLGTEMFHFPRYAPSTQFALPILNTKNYKSSLTDIFIDNANWVLGVSIYHRNRLPHSEISGSKVATHLPEAYRSYAASFIASLCQGIHHLPLFTTFPSLVKRQTKDEEYSVFKERLFLSIQIFKNAIEKWWRLKNDANKLPHFSLNLSLCISIFSKDNYTPWFLKVKPNRSSFLLLI